MTKCWVVTKVYVFQFGTIYTIKCDISEVIALMYQ